jgi:hypothetical protein
MWGRVQNTKFMNKYFPSYFCYVLSFELQCPLLYNVCKCPHSVSIPQSESPSRTRVITNDISRDISFTFPLFLEFFSFYFIFTFLSLFFYLSKIFLSTSTYFFSSCCHFCIVYFAFFIFSLFCKYLFCLLLSSTAFYSSTSSISTFFSVFAALHLVSPPPRPVLLFFLLFLHFLLFLTLFSP